MSRHLPVHSTLRWASFALAPALLACSAHETRCAAGPEEVAAHTSSHAVLTNPAEPGEPLEVSGTVFEPDGVTPAAGVVVYLYHTDASGLYQRRGESAPRLRAWIVTDASGRYSYRTIRPAPYPGDTISAHIHTQMWSDRFPPQYGTDLVFLDDPLVSKTDIEESRRLNRFAWAVGPSRDDGGTWHAVHDLRLESSGDELEDNTMHGWRDCPPELRPREK